MTRWLVANHAVAHAESYPFERPLLHACSNTQFLGDVRLDLRRRCRPDVVGDVRALPFKDDSFGSAFADFPWTGGFRKNIAEAMREMLRVAPVAYSLAPWTWGSSLAKKSWIHVADQPGVNLPLLFIRYERNRPLSTAAVCERGV